MNQSKLNYQILMLDLDGTLLKKHNSIDKQVGKLLKEFCDNGGVIMFNTGRSLTSALKVKDLLWNKFQVQPQVISCFNGSIIYDCIESKIIHEFKIHPDIVNQIVKVAAAKKIKLGIYNGLISAKTSLIVANAKQSTVNFINCLNKQLNYQLYNVNFAYDKVYKILAFSFKNKKRNYLENELNNLGINFAKPTNFMYEITNADSNKGKAIPYMLDVINQHGYNFDKYDICAIGDSGNDLPMFGHDAHNSPTVGLALALNLKLNETHKISNQANKQLKKPHLLAKFIKNYVIKYN